MKTWIFYFNYFVLFISIGIFIESYLKNIEVSL